MFRLHISRLMLMRIAIDVLLSLPTPIRSLSVVLLWSPIRATLRTFSELRIVLDLSKHSVVLGFCALLKCSRMGDVVCIAGHRSLDFGGL